MSELGLVAASLPPSSSSLPCCSVVDLTESVSLGRSPLKEVSSSFTGDDAFETLCCVDRNSRLRSSVCDVNFE